MWSSQNTKITVKNSNKKVTKEVHFKIHKINFI